MAGGRESSDRGMANTPSRFMAPRLVLIAATFVLVAMGLLMIFSASSVSALADMGDPTYYLKRQAVFVVVGTALAAIVAHFDYHVWSHSLVWLLWMGVVGLLMLTAIIGVATKGAVRWVELAGFRFQPSEFAKPVVILTAANILQAWFEEGSLSFERGLGLAAVGVGVPLVLIIVQPDKGTTLIIAATVFVMAVLAGLPLSIVIPAIGALFVVGLVVGLGDDYSRQRILTMLDPWKDPFDTGYQLIQGFYAFGSGGLTGVGLGLSRQKYAYLPEAHNDFIFAIIGEELGLVGALAVLALFVAIIWAGYRIARYAPDLAGTLIAAGSASLLTIQLLLNVTGVLGLFPLSGKPLPFVSYGGSSIMSSLIMVGLMVSVSCASSLPETVYDVRRSQMRVSRDSSGAGQMTPVFKVLDGGNPRGGRERIDLGPSPTERLRGSGSRSVPLQDRRRNK